MVLPDFVFMRLRKPCFRLPFKVVGVVSVFFISSNSNTHLSSVKFFDAGLGLGACLFFVQVILEKFF